VTAAAV